MWPFRKRVNVEEDVLYAFLMRLQAQLSLHREASQKLVEGLRTQNAAMKEIVAGMRELDARLTNTCNTCNNRYDRQTAQIAENRKQLDKLKGVHGS